jgi:hypothetical protein
LSDEKWTVLGYEQRKEVERGLTAFDRNFYINFGRVAVGEILISLSK